MNNNLNELMELKKYVNYLIENLLGEQKFQTDDEKYKRFKGNMPEYLYQDKKARDIYGINANGIYNDKSSDFRNLSKEARSDARYSQADPKKQYELQTVADNLDKIAYKTSQDERINQLSQRNKINNLKAGAAGAAGVAGLGLAGYAAYKLAKKRKAEKEKANKK